MRALVFAARVVYRQLPTAANNFKIDAKLRSAIVPRAASDSGV